MTSFAPATAWANLNLSYTAIALEKTEFKVKWAIHADETNFEAWKVKALAGTYTNADAAIQADVRSREVLNTVMFTPFMLSIEMDGLQNENDGIVMKSAMRGTVGLLRNAAGDSLKSCPMTPTEWTAATAVAVQ